MTDRDDDLLSCYWTVSGPVEVHVGREWSLFDFGRSLRGGREGRASAASGCGTPTSSTCSSSYSLDEMARSSPTTGSTCLELEFLMDWFLEPSDERRVESDRTRASCSWRRPPRCRLTTSRSATSPARPATSTGSPRVRRAVRGRGAPPRHAGRLRVHAVRRQCPGPRHGAGGRRGRRCGQRRPRDRHVAHEQARDPARRAAAHPAPSTWRWVELDDGRSRTCPTSSTRP